MMKSLHFKENFKNFLYDLDNFITIYENYLHVFNYHKLERLSKEEIILTFANKIIKITGQNLLIKKMTKQELLIDGIIMKVEFVYNE